MKEVINNMKKMDLSNEESIFLNNLKVDSYLLE
jgi:hypothetical protein